MGSYNFLQNNLNFSSLIFNNKTILIQPVTEALEASVGRVYINETEDANLLKNGSKTPRKLS